MDSMRIRSPRQMPGAAPAAGIQEAGSLIHKRFPIKRISFNHLPAPWLKFDTALHARRQLLVLRSPWPVSVGTNVEGNGWCLAT